MSSVPSCMFTNTTVRSLGVDFVRIPCMELLVTSFCHMQVKSAVLVTPLSTWHTEDSRSRKFSALPLAHLVTVSRFRGFTSCYRTPATRIRTKSRFTSPIYSHVKVAHSYTGITRAEASASIPGSSSQCCSRHTASASSVRVAIAMADRSSHQARCHSFVTTTR
jgi:hypothetical protein